MNFLVKNGIRLLLFVLALYLAVFTTAAVILMSPRVQNKLVPYIEAFLTEQLGAKVEIGRIDISLFDHVVLRNFALYDKNGQTFVQAAALKVGVFYAPTVGWLAPKKVTRRIEARSVELDSARIFMYQTAKMDDWNFIKLFEGDSVPEPPDSLPGPTVTIDVPCFRLFHTEYIMADSTADPESFRIKPGKLNPLNMRFQNLTIEGSFRLNENKEIFLNVEHLSGRETNGGFPIHYIGFEFAALNESSLPRPEIRIMDMRVRLADSDLDFDFVLPGLPINKLFAKIGNRAYKAHFRPSRLDINSINIFTPEDLPITGVFPYLEGDVEGDYKKIDSRNLSFTYGGKTTVNARVKLRDFTKPDQLFMDLRLKESVVSAQDLVALLPTLKLPKEAYKFGQARVDGRFIGFLSDFVADGSFQTPLGNFDSNINLKIEPKKNIVAYSGELTTQNFNLNELLGLNISSNLNFSGMIRGVDFDFNKMEAESEFVIRRSDFMGYVLDSVGGVMHIGKRKLVGELSLADREGSFEGGFSLHFPQDAEPSYSATGRLRSLDLKHYLGMKDSVALSTELAVNIEGSDPETMVGNVELNNLRMRKRGKNQRLEIQTLILDVEQEDSLNRSITLLSDPVSVSILGEMKNIETVTLLANFAKETAFNFQADTVTVSEYYLTKLPDSLQTRFISKISLHHINPVLAFLGLDMKIKDHTRLQAVFDFQEQCEAELLLQTPTVLEFGDTRLDIEKARIDLTKAANAPALVGSADVSLKELLIDSAYAFQNVRLKPHLDGQVVNYTLDFEQTKLNNHYSLSGVTDFKYGSLITELDSAQSYIQTGDKRWRFPKRNAVLYAANTLIINDFDFIYNDQRISIDANIVPELSSTLDVQVENLNIDIIKQFVPFDAPISGVLNAKTHVDSVLNHPIVQADGLLRSFAFDSVEYGNLTLKSELLRRNEKNLLAVEAKLFKDLTAHSLLDLGGFYDPSDDVSPMDFTLNSYKFPLQMLSPLIGDALYDLKGEAFIDKMKITGSFEHPKANGFCQVAASFGVSYLKTKFALENAIGFDTDVINLPELKLYNLSEKDTRREDAYALVDGHIAHKGFRKFRFFVAIPEIQNFTALNTAKADNNSFYGKAVVSEGFAAVTGPLEDIQVEVTATTGLGTVMNIPLTNYSEQQRLDYVYFKGSRADSLKAAANAQPDAFGMSLILNIFANENANVNIIFDEQTGDMISARGEGNMKMEITKDSDFSMYGGYKVSEGSYCFTFKNLLNKYLVIDKGGTINWSGDPYEAQMNMRAIYRVDNANMQAWDTTSARSRMDVVMNLNGSLMQPQIGFDLEMPQVNQNSSMNTASLLNQVKSDPQELSRQVFSLMMLRSVAPIGRFFGQDATASAASASMSEFLSAQLNAWISKTIDQNIGVSFSLNQDVVMMQLKATLLNNRITIERNGAIVGNQNNDLTLGNINISIKLLPTNKHPSATAGVLAAEIFNRENLSANTVVSTNRGIGIYYKREFDTLGELFRRKKKRKAEERKEIPPPPPKQGTVTEEEEGE